MASMHMGKRLVFLAVICQLLLPLHTLPLQAEETADKAGSEDNITVGKTMAGEEGTASYYARRYHGRRTCSGARYDPEKMTAASPDLPLGCKVKVVNLTNGEEVLVTVNDRCRRKKAPFIDLSRGAARKLGFLGRGSARVRIIPLNEEET